MQAKHGGTTLSWGGKLGWFSLRQSHHGASPPTGASDFPESPIRPDKYFHRA